MSQELAAVQDTPDSAISFPPDGGGSVWADHPVPFQLDALTPGGPPLA